MRPIGDDRRRRVEAQIESPPASHNTVAAKAQSPKKLQRTPVAAAGTARARPEITAAGRPVPLAIEGINIRYS
jgi:hypothetical protein